MLKLEKAFYRIFICLVIAILLWNSARIVTFRFGVDYGEAPLMDQVRKIQNGDSLYKANINEPPYIFLNYPPLYPLLVAGLNFVIKIPLFQAGRLVSLFFALISATIIGLICFKLTQKILLSALAIILFLGHPYVMIWSSLARVDLMALAFSLLGLWVLFQYGNSNWSIGLACLFFLASAFTRQTYIFAGPLAGFTWLWHHQRKRALAFGSIYGFIGLIIFIIINRFSDGGFYSDIVIANINQFSVSRLQTSFFRFFEIWPLILIAILIFIILLGITQFSKRLSDQLRFPQKPFLIYGLLVYSVLAFITTLSVGKVGSSINYFIEMIAGGVIWFVVVIDYFIEKKSRIKNIFVGVLFIQFIWILVFSYQYGNYRIGSKSQHIANYDQLLQRVELASQNGYVLSDDYLDLVLLSGQSLYYEPATYGQLYYAGVWDITGFVHSFEAKEFPLIIIGGNELYKEYIWPAPVITAIENNYVIEKNDDILILTPTK
jgi:uncharacterized membrane protein